MNGRSLAARLAGKDHSKASEEAPATPPHERDRATGAASEGEPDEEMDENLSAIVNDLLEAHAAKDPKAVHAAMKAHHHYMAMDADRDREGLDKSGQPPSFGVVPPGDANRDG